MEKSYYCDISTDRVVAVTSDRRNAGKFILFLSYTAMIILWVNVNLLLCESRGRMQEYREHWFH